MGGGGKGGDNYPLWVPCQPQPLIQSVKQDGGIFRRVQGVREGCGGGELIWGEGSWCGVAGGREGGSVNGYHLQSPFLHPYFHCVAVCRK